MALTTAVAWLDHRRASIIYFSASSDRRITLASSAGMSHLHHKKGAVGGSRAAIDREFFEWVADALADATGILRVGAASAKIELAEYAARYRPPVRACIGGIETVGPPAENPLLAHARAGFDELNRKHSTPAATG